MGWLERGLFLAAAARELVDERRQRRIEARPRLLATSALLSLSYIDRVAFVRELLEAMLPRGNEYKTESWLRRVDALFNWEQPIQLLETNEGTDAVNRALWRIAYLDAD